MYLIGRDKQEGQGLLPPHSPWNASHSISGCRALAYLPLSQQGKKEALTPRHSGAQDIDGACQVLPQLVKPEPPGVSKAGADGKQLLERASLICYCRPPAQKSCFAGRVFLWRRVACVRMSNSAPGLFADSSWPEAALPGPLSAPRLLCPHGCRMQSAPLPALPPPPLQPPDCRHPTGLCSLHSSFRIKAYCFNFYSVFMRGATRFCNPSVSNATSLFWCRLRYSNSGKSFVVVVLFLAGPPA